ncbi:unnamed protein product [Malus baccata var. baccata]
MKNPQLTLGLIFRDNVQFKRAVIMYSLVKGYGEIHFPRNEKLKITAKTWANKSITFPLLTNLYLDRIKLNPTWLVDSFLATMKAYRTLDRVLKIIERKHAEQYTKLWDFAEEVRMTKPGSTVKLKLDEQRFQRIYVCLGACKEGFKAGSDDMGIVNQNGWTFISDKQNGLILAFQNVLPKCQHKFYVRHLMLYGWVVSKTTVPHFKKAMEDVKKLDEKTYKWLVKKHSTQWTKSHIETYLKCDMLLNNLCESFNAVILVPMQKPIITMLQMIHTMLMKRIQIRRGIMMKQVGDLYHKIKKKGTKFQVDAGGGEQYVVDLVEKTCSCRKYGLTGILCNHAIANYVDAYYSKARYLKVYSHLIMPRMVWDGSSANPEAHSPRATKQRKTRQTKT